MTRRVLVVSLLAALVASGCGDPQRRYPLKGLLQEIQADGEFVVAHEDIPGFMPAMTMPFRVKSAEGPFQPGDQVAGTLVVTDRESWIEDVVVTARGLPVAGRDVGSAPGGLGVGDSVPDVLLVNQDGQAIGLGHYRGRVLVLTFVYARCPLPEYCPRLMSQFQQLDERLAKDPALFAATHLLTISFDTAYDTPAVLRAFGQNFVQDRGRGRFNHWELATGEADHVRHAAGLFGLDYISSEGQITHSMRTAVIGPDGRLVKVYRGSLWTVDEVLVDIRHAAGSS